MHGKFKIVYNYLEFKPFNYASSIYTSLWNIRYIMYVFKTVRRNNRVHVCHLALKGRILVNFQKLHVRLRTILY